MDKLGDVWAGEDKIEIDGRGNDQMVTPVNIPWSCPLTDSWPTARFLSSYPHMSIDTKTRQRNLRQFVPCSTGRLGTIGLEGFLRCDGQAQLN